MSSGSSDGPGKELIKPQSRFSTLPRQPLSENERETYTSACMRRHQAFAPAGGSLYIIIFLLSHLHSSINFRNP